MTNKNESAIPTHDAELVDEPGARVSSMTLRSPSVPTTLSELAARKGEAVEIIEARVLVLETLRKASIRATHPEDWILFKAPDDQGGQIVAYLQDCGCDRVRDLYGIEVFGLSRPEKLQGNAPDVFHYVQTGSGRCRITMQVVEDMEGGRSSGDDFCKGKTGADLEVTVRKATRANLDGNITRELAGMKSVPIDQLRDAWAGTNKTTDRCRRGRGFGSRDERLGATRAGVPDVEPPTCPHCKPPNTVKLVYRAGKGDRGAFYGCPNYEKHPQQKIIIDAAKWVAEQAAKAPTPAQDAPAAADEGPAPTFDRRPSESRGTSRREPGAEG